MSDRTRSGGDLRLGLVGCGRLAECGYVPAARLAPQVRLTAVADTDRARCARAAPGVHAYASANELAASGRVDALVLATPTEEHLDGALVATRAGLPVLVEKPPARDGSEAARLAALSPAVWVGFNRRLEPAAEAIRSALPRAQWLELALRLDYRRHSWSPYVPHGDALLDLAPHLVDLARWLTRSEVSRVRAPACDDERAVLEVELEAGTAHLRCASNRPWHERVEVRDRAGRLVARHVRGGVARAALTAIRRRDGQNPLVTSLARQLEAFSLAARGRQATALATAVDGVAVMSAIDAARDSARDGGAWRPVRSTDIGSAA